MKALAVHLTAEDLAHLDKLTKPTFGFPQSMQPLFGSIHHGSMSVNGADAPILPFIMQPGQKPY